MKPIQLAAACLLSAAAAGQPLPEPHGWGGGPPRPGSSSEMIIEERVMIGDCDSACPPLRLGRERRMLEAVRISRMTEALDLTDDQVARFFPRLRKMEEALRALDRQRDSLTAEMERLLAGAPREAELKARLGQLDRIEEHKQRRMLSDRAELDALLSLSQRARLRVFNQRFEDEVRTMVRTIRERRMKHLRP